MGRRAEVFLGTTGEWCPTRGLDNPRSGADVAVVSVRG